MKLGHAIALASVGWYLMLILSFCRSTQAAGPVKVLKVFVQCSTDDSIGSRLCFAIKEKIRASRGFELIEDSTVGACGIHLVSVDAGDNGADSAVSETYTVVSPKVAPFEVLLTSSVRIVGSERVDHVAEATMAELEEATDFLRK